MDSLEQLHVEGHRKGFFKWPGWHRQHSDTRNNAQMLRAGGIFPVGLSCVRVAESTDRGRWQRAFPPCTMKCCTGSLTSANQLRLPSVHFKYLLSQRSSLVTVGWTATRGNWLDVISQLVTTTSLLSWSVFAPTFHMWSASLAFLFFWR